MRNVTVGLIQLENKYFDLEYNLAHGMDLVRQAAAKGAQIVLLPECFISGYNGEVLDRISEFAQTKDSPSVQKLCALAAELGIYLIAPMAMKLAGDDSVQNAALVIDDTGKIIGEYAKHHLFGTEVDNFSRYGGYPVIDTKYGKIAVMICADNNHPESALIYAIEGAEIIFHACAWRIQEFDIWPLLNRCHAVENNIFICVANVYSNKEDLYLFGNSMVVNPRGQVLEELGTDSEGIIVHTIDLDELDKYRSTMPSLKDRHPEDYGIITAPVNV